MNHVSKSMQDKKHKSPAQLVKVRSVKQIDEYHFDLCGLLDTNGNMHLTEIRRARTNKVIPSRGEHQSFGIHSMSINENMIVIYVPESLIPGLRELTGPVLFDMDKLKVDGGFALRADEFVTNPLMQKEADRIAGYVNKSPL